MIEYENLPSSIWAEAWARLYSAFGERMDDEALELMDAVFKAVVADYQEELARREEMK